MTGEAVTLTFEALNRAQSVWFLVSGDAKAEAVALALAEPHADQPDEDPALARTPARGVRGRAETVWFLDTAAASRL